MHSLRNEAVITSTETVPEREEPSFEFVLRPSKAVGFESASEVQPEQDLESEEQPELHFESRVHLEVQLDPQVLEIAGEFALLLYTGVEAKAGTAA